MYLQGFFAALFNLLYSFVNSKLPLLAKRRALSPLFTVIIIIVAIAVGGIIIYILVVTPGGQTSTYGP